MRADREGLRARLLATFHDEAEELLGEITAHLRALDGSRGDGDAAPPLDAAFRAMHTLKGAARSVSLGEIEALCQACEAALSRLGRGEATVQAATVERLREATDGIARLIAEGPRAVRWQELAQRVAQTSAAAPSPQTPAAAPLA
ncbi:MAG TPA: Hpt domain-containing protein, partial [Stellaceae bacterium]|nr:Hpt domain-containing protein [Stellaceae bacterium]